MHRYVLRTVAASVLLFVSPLARAQATGFAVNHFDPSERGSDWFVLESLDLRGHMRPAIGVVGEWAYRPLVKTDQDGNFQRSIITHQVVIHPGASLVLWERLRLAVSVPIQVFANGHTTVINGVTYAPPANETAIGDVRLGADVRLLGTYGDPFTAAMGAQVDLPTGDSASYSGDGSARVLPRVLIAGTVGQLAYAAKLGLTIRGLDESFGNSHVGNDILFGVAAGISLLDHALVIGPELFGRTVVVNHEAFTEAATPVELLFGAHYKIADAWRIGAGISAGLTPGFGAPRDRGLLSFEWAPGIPPADRDQDSIVDTADACIDVAGVRTDDPRTNGCPALPSDRDHDGILDDVDACIDVPGVRTEDPKTNGCPAPQDRDHDGVLDGVDACIDVPGEKTKDPKTNGCPPADRDGDGVLDRDDACPDIAGLKTTNPQTNGCPDPDRDKDSIPNELDACPDEAGKPDPDPKKNGCPKAFVREGQIKILDQVKFKTGSALLSPESDEVLRAVFQVLKDHPEVKAVLVEGHTDSRGTAASNKKLSAARAASVVHWLVGRGIEADLLTSAGFGLERPIDTNDTDQGRQNNRRVEFHIRDNRSVK